MSSMSKVSVRRVSPKDEVEDWRRFPGDWELAAGNERAKFRMKGGMCDGINVYRTGKGTFVATKGSHGPVIRNSKSNSPRNAIGKALKSLGCMLVAHRGDRL
jgi:hypothetical protein